MQFSVFSDVSQFLLIRQSTHKKKLHESKNHSLQLLDSSYGVQWSFPGALLKKSWQNGATHSHQSHQNFWDPPIYHGNLMQHLQPSSYMCFLLLRQMVGIFIGLLRLQRRTKKQSTNTVSTAIYISISLLS
jgi:hypothetical protein